MINKDNVKNFAWIGDEYVSEIKSIVLFFHGLGYKEFNHQPYPNDLEIAASGGLVVSPFDNPWSWMNKEAIVLTDMIVDAVIEKYGLSSDIPIISTGGSMGGLSALIYSRYAKRTPVACMTNCPVCDLPFHYNERADLPRTLYSAFAHYECGIEKAMELHSPVHQVENMPRIPYFIIHGEEDATVKIQPHADVFVSKMKKNNHDIEYIVAKGMGHCVYNSYELHKKSMDFLKRFVK